MPSLHFTSTECAFVKRWLKMFIEPDIGPQTFEGSIKFSRDQRDYFRTFLNRMDNASFKCSKARKVNQLPKVQITNSLAKGRVERAGTRVFNLIKETSANTISNFEDLGGSNANLTLRVDSQTRKYPWELAYDGKEFLCTKFCVGRKLSRPNSVYLPSPEPQHKDALVVGLDYDWSKCTLNELDHPEYEARSVATQLRKLNYKVHLLLGNEATIKEVKKWLSKGVSVFHFTGHGICRKHSSEGEKVLLALRDGYLTTEDLRESFERAKGAPYLSFLNACETAMEIYSSELVDAFVDLGAENVIGTFWSVFDEPSKLFARDFYRMLEKNNFIGSALRKARNLGKTKDAITWPAFVYYGDPGQVLPRAK